LLLVINIAVGAWVFLHRPPPAEAPNQAGRVVRKHWPAERAAAGRSRCQSIRTGCGANRDHGAGASDSINGST